MYTLGIDIGSTTSKCVILQDGEKLVAKSLQLGGLGTEGPADALTQLWHDSGLHREEMARVIVTGYGRNKFDFPIMTRQRQRVTAMTCQNRCKGITIS